VRRLRSSRISSTTTDASSIFVCTTSVWRGCRACQMSCVEALLGSPDACTAGGPPLSRRGGRRRPTGAGPRPWRGPP
jgi:hypothetical protein